MGKKGKKGHGKHGSHGATHPHYKGQEFPSIEAAAVAAMHLLDVEDEEKHHWLGPAVASKKKSEREAPLDRPTAVAYTPPVTRARGYAPTSPCGRSSRGRRGLPWPPRCLR